MLFERAETDLHPLLFEDVSETALGKTPVQRHLTAFESDLARITWTRFLSLLAATCGLAQTWAWSTPDSLLLVSRTLRGLQSIKTDSHHLLLATTMSFGLWSL